MAKNGAENRETVAKLNAMPSLHLSVPVMDADGVPRRVLYRDEAKWVPDALILEIGDGPQRAGSGLLVAKNMQQASGQVQAVPVVVWRVWLFGKKPGDGSAAFTIPFDQAVERVPQRMMPEPSGEGLRSVPLEVYEKAKKDAALTANPRA